MSVRTRIKDSFDRSVGSIVFGMEDGTVSIFGLVFGSRRAAPDSKAVFLAGATGGAAAAAVSMMAGAFLDAESANDQDAAKLHDLRERLDRSFLNDERGPEATLDAGYSDSEVNTLLELVGRHPESRLRITAALEFGIVDTTRQSPWRRRRGCSSRTSSRPRHPRDSIRLVRPRYRPHCLSRDHRFAARATGSRPRRDRSPQSHTTVFETLGIAAGAAVAGFAIGTLIT